MNGLRGIVICVEYDDLLALTLPRNLRHFEECVVVTSLTDQATVDLCNLFPNVRVLQTNAFYEGGARFNKGAAMEAGFDFLGRDRDGWVLIWDADTELPERMPDVANLDRQRIYGARRRILNDPRKWSPADLDWNSLPIRPDRVIPGYFQLFNTSAEVLRRRPWYDTTYVHAGGADTYFERLWPPQMRGWLSSDLVNYCPMFQMRGCIEVLHIGPCDHNWFGRATQRLDGQFANGHDERRNVMREFLASRGWGVPKSGKPFFEHIGQTEARVEPY